ncbi:hypothetical protein [Saccharopolyspora sp. CA-218241]|uniref:hypothetical protein n=1 Tax=Saccharopolyspora sp. CA-218241 TaxID=3240027 RepID=UPI003D9783F8
MVVQQPERSRRRGGGGLTTPRTTLRVLAVVFLPWQAAKFLHKPAVGRDPRGRLLDRLTFWRAAVGLAVVVFASHEHQTVREVLGNVQDKTEQTGLYALIGLPAVFLVLLLVTRAAHRWQLLARVPRLLRRALIGFASIWSPIVWFAAFYGFATLVEGWTDTDSLLRLAVILGGIALTLFCALWSSVFLTCTLYWAARTSIWLSELHPLLAPVASVGLVLVVSGLEIHGGDTKGLPYWLWLGLNLCGLVSTLVLAFFEYRHLRSAGYRFRDGPTRLPARHLV